MGRVRQGFGNSSFYKHIKQIVTRTNYSRHAPTKKLYRATFPWKGWGRRLRASRTQSEGILQQAPSNHPAAQMLGGKARLLLVNLEKSSFTKKVKKLDFKGLDFKELEFKELDIHQ